MYLLNPEFIFYELKHSASWKKSNWLIIERRSKYVKIIRRFSMHVKLPWFHWRRRIRCGLCQKLKTVIHLKGTVSRDFLLLVFPLNSAPPCPIRDVLGPFWYLLLFGRVISIWKRLCSAWDTAEWIRKMHVEKKFQSIKKCNPIVISIIRQFFYYMFKWACLNWSLDEWNCKTTLRGCRKHRGV